MKRKVKVVTLRVDKHYWDAAEIVHTADDGWVRTPLGGRGDCPVPLGEIKRGGVRGKKKRETFPFFK